MAIIEINKNPSIKDLRWFALLWFPAFLGVVGGLIWHRTGLLEVSVALWCAGALVAVVGGIAPKAVRWLFLGWMYAAYPIGFVISHVLLGGVFFGILTPIALVMRLAGRDALHLRKDPQAKSHWVPREQPGSSNPYFKQF